MDLFVRVTDAGRHQPYRMVGATHRLDVGESYATPREAIAFCNHAAANARDAEFAPEVAPAGDDEVARRPGASQSEHPA